MDPPNVTIEAQLTREGLLNVRDAIDALLDDLQRSPNAPSPETLQTLADKKVEQVWTRVGDNIKRFLVEAALMSANERSFTMNDIAKELGRDPKTVRSWHRNLGRTLRHLDAEIPEPLVLEHRWDGGRNLYLVPKDVRKAIIARDTPSPWDGY